MLSSNVGTFLNTSFMSVFFVILESSRSNANQNKTGNKRIRCIHLKICFVRQDFLGKAYLKLYLSFSLRILSPTVIICNNELEILHAVYLSVIILLVIIIVGISVIHWRIRRGPGIVILNI